MRDPRFDVLFEPVAIGPHTSRNRFYQVPHCSGMGWQRPNALAAMRGVKAEGGWGVVCTEYCSVHPSSDDQAYPYAALWDDGDIAANALMTDAVHEHGALAGVELWLGGNYVANAGTRIPTIGLRSLPGAGERHIFPVQSRRADREDISEMRRWHTAAAKRAVDAGFDIVYVYATHGYLLSEFLDANTNDRTDEYGGTLKNRVRLVRELIEETKEVVGHRCAVAARFSVDLADAETLDAFELLADLPDLWDLTVPDYEVEMGSSRFVGEGALVDSVAAARLRTRRPVVAVGRYTSPDAMVRAIRSGTQDLIGAARPSIADPFLPRKIEEGRLDDIRECIGCNICYAHNSLGVPIRCTQNPTMGEEWRRGWHPERIAVTKRRERVLVVGAGPAGLEAARVAGEIGHEVMLAEATRELGGRILQESALPGLSAWRRVRDWRAGQIEKLPNVEIFRESRMTAHDVAALEARHVLVACGSCWTTDGIGRRRVTPLTLGSGARIVSAKDVLEGVRPEGHVVLYDEELYYLGAALALQLRAWGNRVTLVTSAGRVGPWTVYTEELFPVNAALIERGIEVVTNTLVEGMSEGNVHLSCYFTGRSRVLGADALLPLTRRVPADDLYYELKAACADRIAAGTMTVRRIGDAEAPSIIAGAVYSGYRAGIELGQSVDEAAIYSKREVVPIGNRRREERS